MLKLRNSSFIFKVFKTTIQMPLNIVLEVK